MLDARNARDRYIMELLKEIIASESVTDYIKSRAINILLMVQAGLTDA